MLLLMAHSQNDAVEELVSARVVNFLDMKKYARGDTSVLCGSVVCGSGVELLYDAI